MNLFMYVKSKISILDVVGSYTTLKRAGGYWKGCCPFHDERTPSFTVTPGREIFYCFGCQANGDAISFIAAMERCSPVDAVYFLIERYKLTVPSELMKYDRQAVDAAQEHRKRYWQLFGLVAQWFHDQLWRSNEAQIYLKTRSISHESINHFKLGFFTGGVQALHQLLKSLQHHHFLAQDLIDAHILFEGANGLYSPLQERIIFPIKDQMGRFCAFGGRIFGSKDERAKYYNLKETNYFHKGSTLFNLDAAKASMQEQGMVFIVEGYLDCIALVQHGYLNTVATLGTACTLDHLKAISRHAHHVYILYDGDAAGQQAIMRLTNLCWQVDLELYVVKLPAQHDPASLLAAGIDLSPYIAQSTDIFLFFIQTLGVDFQRYSLQEKIQAAKRLLDMIAGITDPLKQDLLLTAGAQALDVPFATLKKYLKPAVHASPERAKGQNEEISRYPMPPLDKVSIIEKKIFSVIINNMSHFKEIDPELIACFAPPLQTILLKMQHRLAENDTLTFIQFYQELSEEERYSVNGIISLFRDYTDYTQLANLGMQLKRQRWKELVHLTQQKLLEAQQAGNYNEVERLLQEFNKIKIGLATS